VKIKDVHEDLDHRGLTDFRFQKPYLIEPPPAGAVQDIFCHLTQGVARRAKPEGHSSQLPDVDYQSSILDTAKE